jgi:uncharacterized membrane protein
MVPFTVMVAAIAAARVAGWLFVPALDDWAAATRAGLAVMFAFTGASHFARTRQDFIRMVPPRLPAPALLVTATGLAQLAGAVGLVLPGYHRTAAVGLIVLLIAMFPANVYAATTPHTIAGRPHTPLPFRAALQVMWIGLVAWSALE